MAGTAYAVGVGPGDPELLTQKAVRLIRESGVIAFPGRKAEDSAAYRIAEAAVPEIKEKELVPVHMPMTRDVSALAEAHRKGAETLEHYLGQGRDVVWLSLGDPAVYCSFSYLKSILEQDGYETVLVPGVTSFCAAAAELGTTLAEGEEPVHIFPAVHAGEDALDQPGTYVLMKSGSRMSGVKELLIKSGRDVQAVENCGMDGEKIYRSAEEIPDDAGYFTLIVAKEKRD